MSVAEMKKIVQEEVNNLSEDKLVRVKKFIDTINSLPVEQSVYIKHAQDIISERSSLLEKLAQ